MEILGRVRRGPKINMIGVHDLYVVGTLKGWGGKPGSRDVLELLRLRWWERLRLWMGGW